MTELGREFAELILRRRAPGEADDPVAGEEESRRLDATYRMLWSTVVMYLSYGSGYASPRQLSDKGFVEELAEIAERSLVPMEP